jgi:hypothetical protein
MQSTPSYTLYIRDTVSFRLILSPPSSFVVISCLPNAVSHPRASGTPFQSRPILVNQHYDKGSHIIIIICGGGNSGMVVAVVDMVLLVAVIVV